MRGEALEAIASAQTQVETDSSAKTLDLRFYSSRAASDSHVEGGGLPRGEETEAILREADGGARVLYPCAVPDS